MSQAHSSSFSHDHDHRPTGQDVIATACATPRYMPYRFIHKGLRVLMTTTLCTAGALDAAQPADRSQLVDEVERLLATCADHLAHENQFFHEALRRHAPRAVVPFHDDHQDHIATIDALTLLLQRVRDAGDATQAQALAYELHLRLSMFIGESLVHMAEEETTLTTALWAHFTDAELAEIEGALQATLAPQEMAFYLRWMAQGMNAGEMVHLLQGLREQAPPPVFEGVSDVLRTHAPARSWAPVAQALGLPATPPAC